MFSLTKNVTPLRLLLELVWLATDAAFSGSLPLELEALTLDLREPLDPCEVAELVEWSEWAEEGRSGSGSAAQYLQVTC